MVPCESFTDFNRSWTSLFLITKLFMSFSKSPKSISSFSSNSSSTSPRILSSSPSRRGFFFSSIVLLVSSPDYSCSFISRELWSANTVVSEKRSEVEAIRSTYASLGIRCSGSYSFKGVYSVSFSWLGRFGSGKGAVGLLNSLLVAELTETWLC